MFNNEKIFNGKVAVVTGGAGDIGLATALHLGELGACIALLDIDDGKLADATARLKSSGIKRWPFNAMSQTRYRSKMPWSKLLLGWGVLIFYLTMLVIKVNLLLLISTRWMTFNG
ncbi:hypothetical protein Q427_34245 [Halomonas sp. BC04]|nr:hypothetical protein Q427_34245 [Halomonas sp. BC04]